MKQESLFRVEPERHVDLWPEPKLVGAASKIGKTKTTAVETAAFERARMYEDWNPPAGLKKALRSLSRSLYAEHREDAETILWYVDGGWMPDGWRIDQVGDRHEIHLLEIEHTNPLNDQKLRFYSNFWFGLDCGGVVSLHVWRVDASGCGSAEVPLWAHWYRLGGYQSLGPQPEGTVAP